MVADSERAAFDSFTEIPHVAVGAAGAEHSAVADGFVEQVLVRWGDPIVKDEPAFDVASLTPQSQERRFGYNNDFIAFLPLPLGSKVSDRGLLCVNHEYTLAPLMFQPLPLLLTAEQKKVEIERRIRIEMAAHGHSVVEVRREKNGRWALVQDSAFNRRITALTEIEISGPAAGHERLRTRADKSGRKVLGTLNNCAGGVTPWGTVLSGEENVDGYFHFVKIEEGQVDALIESRIAAGGDEKTWRQVAASWIKEARNHKRFQLGKERIARWEAIDPRFLVHPDENVDAIPDPNELNRFGWVLEIDPYDRSRPVRKRTALGRMKHEGATVALNGDGRVVVYMGDDQRFEFVYKFVSEGRFDPDRRETNFDLLDHGTLYAARFDHSGKVHWLPLEYQRKDGADKATAPLDEEHGFFCQADVLIEAREAATLMGATPMDRPEDIEVDGANVYVILTNNKDREETDSANPRPDNRHGHVLRLVVPSVDGKPDHAALEHDYEVFLKGGDPANPEHGAQYDQGTSADGWLSCPDNGVIDLKGRLWIATDGAQKDARIDDGIYLCETMEPGMVRTRHFYRAPCGSEVCGPCFTPDGATLFAAVQHPGEGSTFEQPSTRWPDFDASLPPRPAVVALYPRSP